MSGVVVMEDWNKKKNDLTWKLLGEGYTPENHPDYVKWVNYMYEFEYAPEHVRKMVLESPCGLLMKGTEFNGYMSYMGIDWRLENDNSVHACPYKKVNCELNHEYLRKGFGPKHNIVNCAFHMTDKPYNYENSCEKICDEFHAMQEYKRKEFYNSLKWNPEARYCPCINWDDDKQDWKAKYDPWHCISGCYNDICVLTGKRLDGKQANIYYDVKTTTEYRKGFIIEPIIKIKKGVKLFDSTKSVPILEAYIKAYPDAPYEREKGKGEHSQKLFFAKYHGRKYDLEILNVRIELRETRDLLQDLQDAQEGIEVIHESDFIKEKKQAKREAKIARQKAKERKSIVRMKKLVESDINENLKAFAKAELKKKGIIIGEIPEQLSMF
jgi:hypothetical protein